METRKISIYSFLEGYIAACDNLQVPEKEVFPQALQAAIDKYDKMPIYRSALIEIIKEFSTQK